MYVCEDCGHSTSDPEVHFKHLQQNHPFCPALARCHDKRQFKFNAVKSETSAVKHISSSVTVNDVSAAEDGVTETSIKIEPQERLVSSTRDSSEADVAAMKKDSRPAATETSDRDRDRNSTPGERTDAISNPTDTGKRLSAPEIQLGPKLYPPTDRLTNKRHNNETTICTSPQKKPKTLNSPKKQKQQSSPTKVRMQPFGVSENGSVPVSKLNLENVSSKKFADQPVKKRPLGSLTQNTIYQLSYKNAHNKQVSGGSSGDNGYAPKNTLGSVIDNKQW